MEKTINQTGVLLVVVLFVILLGFAYLKANGKLPENYFVIQQPETDTQQVGFNLLTGTSWQLTKLTQNGNDIPLPQTQVTAQFSDSELTGATPCNTYSSPYNLKGMAVNFPSLTVSSMTCDPTVAPFIQAYFEALNQVGSFKIIQIPQTTLTLYPRRGGNSQLTYTRQ